MMSTVYAQLGTAALILAVLGLRAAFKNRFPAKVFVILWAVIMVWSLLPFGISTNFSIYKYAPEGLSTENKALSTANKALSTEYGSAIEDLQSTGAQASVPEESSTPEIIAKPENEGIFAPEISHNGAENSVLSTPRTEPASAAPAKPALSTEKILSKIRICGAAVMAAYITVKYIFDVNKYRRFASPCGGAAAQWISAKPKGGKMRVWESAEVESPLTFGLFRPVILLPLGVTPEQLPNLLAHEYVHARDKDFLLRGLCSLALAWSWFNPLVWAAVVFMNRDIERYCDERSIKLLGGSGADYMHTLLDYAERQSGISALSYFSAGSFEERINSIIKGKNKRIGIISAVAVTLIVIAVAVTFGTAPKKSEQKNEFTEKIYASETAQWQFDDVFGEGYFSPLHTDIVLKWLPDSAITAATEDGTPVYAMQSGKVSAAVRTAHMGWAIAIEQDDGDTAVYANLGAPDRRAAVGNRLEKGSFVSNTDGEHGALLIDILRGGKSVFCGRSFEWYFDDSAALSADSQALCDDSAAPELAEAIKTLTSSYAFFEFKDFDLAAGINAEQSEYLNYAALIYAYNMEWFEAANSLSEEKQRVIAEKWDEDSQYAITLSMKAESIMYSELFAREMTGTDIPERVRHTDKNGGVLYIPEIGCYVMNEPQGIFGMPEYPQIFSVEKNEGNYTTYTVKFVLCGVHNEYAGGKRSGYISFGGGLGTDELVSKADTDRLIAENDVYGARIVKLRDGSTYIDAMWKGSKNPFGTNSAETDPGSISDEKLKAVAEDAVIAMGAELQEDGTLRVSDLSLLFNCGFNSADEISPEDYYIWRYQKAIDDREEILQKPDGSAYFKRENYEPVIKLYFDVSSDALRSGGCYHASEDAYWPEELGGFGKGASEEVHVTGIEKSGDLLHIKLELVYSDTGVLDTRRTLTVRQESDGGCKIVSYSKERQIYETVLSENGDEAQAAIAAVRGYVHHDLAQSSIIKISADINQTNFFINRIFAEEYGAVFDDFTSQEYCRENFLVIRTVRKLYFKNDKERGNVLNSFGGLLNSSDECPVTYFVLRDAQTGEWSVRYYARNDYDAFDGVDYSALQRMFIANYDIIDYAGMRLQKSEIDPEGTFARSCTDSVQRDIVSGLESYKGVKSCRVISCEVDIEWTNRMISAYWNGNGSYPNYTLAKRFLVTNTVVEIELADGYENSDFSELCYLIDIDMEPVMRLKKTDTVIYDPENLVKWSRTSESGWKRVDGFAFMNE